MDPKEYPKSNMSEIAEKRPGEEGLVGNVGEAYQKADEVKELAGEKIDAEFERLVAMKQFSGLGEEVAKCVGKIKKMYEDAEAAMEGKKYADIMRLAFDEVVRGNAPELAIVARENLYDFIKFLEVKFSPKLVDKEDHQSRAGAVTYLRIKGTNFIFVLRLGDYPKSIRLMKASPDFIKNLIEID